MSETEKTTLDSNFKFEVGTEQMLLEASVSGSHEITGGSNLKDWMTEDYDGSPLTTWDVFQFTEDSASHYKFGVAVGGDDPGVENEAGFRSSASDTQENHVDNEGHSAYIETEIYRNNGGDLLSDWGSLPDPIHRKTWQYLGAGDDTVYVGYEAVPEQPQTFLDLLSGSDSASGSENPSGDTTDNGSAGFQGSGENGAGNDSTADSMSDDEFKSKLQEALELIGLTDREVPPEAARLAASGGTSANVLGKVLRNRQRSAINRILSQVHHLGLHSTTEPRKDVRYGGPNPASLRVRRDPAGFCRRWMF